MVSVATGNCTLRTPLLGSNFYAGILCTESEHLAYTIRRSSVARTVQALRLCRFHRMTRIAQVVSIQGRIGFELGLGIGCPVPQTVQSTTQYQQN